MAQTYLLESPPPRNSRTKPSPLYLVILELYPSSSRAQSKEMAVWKKNSARYLVMISGGGPHNRPICAGGQHNRPPAQMCMSFLAAI